MVPAPAIVAETGCSTSVRSQTLGSPPFPAAVRKEPSALNATSYRLSSSTGRSAIWRGLAPVDQSTTRPASVPTARVAPSGLTRTELMTSSAAMSRVTVWSPEALSSAVRASTVSAVSSAATAICPASAGSVAASERAVTASWRETARSRSCTTARFCASRTPARPAVLSASTARPAASTRRRWVPRRRLAAPRARADSLSSRNSDSTAARPTDSLVLPAQVSAVSRAAPR